ncbi:MAG: putative MerR family transcriptional regulator [Actinomycetia bacterium]|nr:putative MerR family transcriptional regulator [Actinomycetes bacterium]
MADVPDDLLRIGPFSRASWLSIKALRAYHEAGLLVPAVVDPATGYRSYTAAQLTDAVTIRRLLDLDVPLAAIGQVLDARDPEVTRKVLAEHGRVLEERVAAMQRALEELYVGVGAPVLHTPVHRRFEPARTALLVDGRITDDFEPFLERTRTLLGEAAAASGAVVTGSFGGLYAEQLDDDGQDATAFLPMATAPHLVGWARAAGVRIGELPATDVAVLAHRGTYDTLDDTYLKLGAWVAANAASAELPVREVYVVGADEADLPDDLHTEICWPVRQETHP